MDRSQTILESTENDRDLKQIIYNPEVILQYL